MLLFMLLFIIVVILTFSLLFYLLLLEMGINTLFLVAKSLSTILYLVHLVVFSLL